MFLMRTPSPGFSRVAHIQLQGLEPYKVAIEDATSAVGPDGLV